MLTIKHTYIVKVDKDTFQNILRSAKNDIVTSVFLMSNKQHEDSIPQAVSNVSFAIEKVLKLYIACKAPGMIKKDPKSDDIAKMITSNTYLGADHFFLKKDQSGNVVLPIMLKDVVDRLKCINPNFEKKWAVIIDDLKNNRNDHVHAYIEKYDEQGYKEIIIKGVDLFVEVLLEIKKMCPKGTVLYSRKDILPKDLERSFRVVVKDIDLKKEFEKNSKMVIGLVKGRKSDGEIFEKLTGIKHGRDWNSLKVKCPSCSDQNSCKAHFFISRAVRHEKTAGGEDHFYNYFIGTVKLILCKNCGAFFKTNSSLAFKNSKLSELLPSNIFYRLSADDRFESVYREEEFKTKIPKHIEEEYIEWFM